MAAPLSGLTVIDCSTTVAGPYCGMILGDLGANVIKVEPPHGDIGRMIGPPFKGGIGAYFANANRNKRGIVLDLKQRDGYDALTRLAESADVFLHNFRPGVAERIGIDAPTLTGLNDQLIYCTIYGFGPSGPLADAPCYDTVVQGLSGLTSIQGESDEPELVKTLLVDKVTGLTALYAIQAALFERTRTGRGQTIDLNMLDTFVSFLFPDVFMKHAFLPEEEFADAPTLAGVHRTWRASDGYLTIIMVTDAQFAGLAHACGCPEWIEDPRFADLPTRVQNFPALVDALVEVLRTRSVQAWLDTFKQHGVPATPVHTLEAVTRDQQVAANGTFMEFAHHTAGPMRMPHPPTRFDGQRLEVTRGAPLLGEHTTEILSEYGYDETAVAGFLASGAAQQG